MAYSTLSIMVVPLVIQNFLPQLEIIKWLEANKKVVLEHMHATAARIFWLLHPTDCRMIWLPMIISGHFCLGGGSPSKMHVLPK